MPQLPPSVTAAGLCLAAGLAVAPASQAQLDNIDHHRMLGIDRDTGMLSRFTFWEQAGDQIGVVEDSDGHAMLGIEAAAYFPGFNNAYALWQDDRDGQNKLVYVDVRNSEATVMADDVEGGKFTGATAFQAGEYDYRVYTIQHEKIKPPAVITGLISINPNNSAASEFYCETPHGRITRDLLHQSTTTDAEGVFYEGDATVIHVKPKGSGEQTGVQLDGEPMVLKNSNTYTFAGEMEVRIYNDHLKNGKAMGQWYIEVVSGTARLNDEVQVLSPHRLSLVSQLDGSVTEIMRLSRGYHGLATFDGMTFFTHDGTNMYLLDAATETETKLSAVPSQASDLEFVGEELRAYSTGYGTLYQMQTSDDGTTTSTNQRQVGLGDLGTIMFHSRGWGPRTPLYD